MNKMKKMIVVYVVVDGNRRKCTKIELWKENSSSMESTLE